MRQSYSDAPKVPHLERIVWRLSQELARVAEWAIVAMMALIVVNIVLRLFRCPLFGVYEYIGFLAALVIGLAIAYCGTQRGHISVSILMDRFSQRTQAIVDIIIGVISIALLGMVAWQLGLYATSMAVSGQLTHTTRVPFYPLIYVTGFCFAVLCLVLVVDVFKAVARLTGVKK
ncbi:hypothetical protein ES703_110933 [subsurface metagenome]